MTIILKTKVQWKQTKHDYDLTFKLLTIDKELASEMLSTSTRNRKTATSHLERLKQLMVQNAYENLYDPICFDYNGVLIDGHHRLMALRDTDKTHQFLVIEGYPPYAFWVMDQVKPRTAIDQLTIEQVPLAGIKSKALKMLYRLDHSFSRSSETAPTNFLLGKYNELHDMTDACTKAHEDYVTEKWKDGPTALLRYIYEGIDEDKANMFWDQAKDPDSADGNPSGTLRKKLLSEMGKADETSGNRAIRANSWTIWVHDAWMHYINNKSMFEMSPDAKHASIWDDLIGCVHQYRPTNFQLHIQDAS